MIFARRRPYELPPAFEKGRRYWAETTIRGEPDNNCVIGYDEPLETFFFQSGDEANGSPVVWIGKRFREVQTYDDLRREMERRKVKLLSWSLEP